MTCHNLVKLPSIYVCLSSYLFFMRIGCLILSHFFLDAGRHGLDQGCHISITALGTSTFALRSSSTHDKVCQDSVFVCAKMYLAIRIKN